MTWGPFLFLAALGTLTFGIVGGLIHLALRRAAPRAALAVAWVAGALVLLSVIPAPLPAGAAVLGGVVTSNASISVDAAEGAPFAMTTSEGSGRLERDATGAAVIEIECSTRCYFDAGMADGRFPPYARSVTFSNATRPTATLAGGEIEMWEGHAACVEAPLLFVTLFGAFTCAPDCRDVWTASGKGEVVLRAATSRLCY